MRHDHGSKSNCPCFCSDSNVNNTTTISDLGTSFLSEFPSQVEILHEVFVAMKLRNIQRDDLRLKVNILLRNLCREFHV